MGSGQSKLKVLDIQQKLLQKHMSIQPSSYVQPFRQFQSEYHKRSSSTMQQSIIKIKAPQQQLMISLNQQKFRQIQQAYQQKTKNFQIQSIIFDDYYTDRFIYVVKDLDFIKTIIIREFQNYQSHVFGNVACQVVINQEITKGSHNNLLLMNESYIIENEDIKFKCPYTQVMELEPVSASLAEIIKYRRENNWQWAEEEFHQLVFDLTAGLNALHASNITHNDLRLENIFYSSAKKCYKIGQFSYATKNAVKGNLRSNRASINYTAPQVNSKETYDLKKADVYSLGNALLCALFLSNPINIQQGNRNLHRLKNTKAIQAVTQMLKPQAQRKSIQTIAPTLQNLHYENKSMQNLIKSLRYKINPKSKNVQKYKLATSQFYKRLGLWQDWRSQVDEVLQTDHTLNNYQQAQIYKQLALINYCQDQLDESTSNAKRAAKIYREMGEEAFSEGNLNLALKEFKSAVECSTFYVNKYDLDLAKSLICLSKVHAQKREEKYSMTLLTQAKELIIKQSSHQSILYSQMKIKQAQLEKKFFRYEQSLQDLKQAFRVARKMQGINQKSSRLCQAKIQTLMAQNLIEIAKKCVNLDQKLQNLQKAEQYLNNSKNIYQTLTDLDCHLELAQNTQVLGLYNVQKLEYAEAKLCFQKSLQMRRWYQQNKKQPQFITAHGNTLSNLGRCQRLMNESKSADTYKQALKHQEQALQIFRGVYGSDHNFNSACVLKQMGELYEEMGQLNQSRDCFQCSRQILSELYGENSPYDQIGTGQKILRN